MSSHNYFITDTKNGKDPTTRGCPNAVAIDNGAYDQSIEVTASSFKVHAYACITILYWWSSY